MSVILQEVIINTVFYFGEFVYLGYMQLVQSIAAARTSIVLIYKSMESSFLIIWITFTKQKIHCVDWWRGCRKRGCDLHADRVNAIYSRIGKQSIAIVGEHIQCIKNAFIEQWSITYSLYIYSTLSSTQNVKNLRKDS